MMLQNVDKARVHLRDRPFPDVKFAFLPGFLLDFGGSANVCIREQNTPQIRMSDGKRQLLTTSSLKFVNDATLSMTHSAVSLLINYTEQNAPQLRHARSTDQWWWGIGLFDPQVNYSNWMTTFRSASRARTLMDFLLQKGGRPDPGAQRTLEKGPRLFLWCRSAHFEGGSELFCAAALFFAAAAAQAWHQRTSCWCCRLMVSIGAICATADAMVPFPPSACQRPGRDGRDRCGRPSPGRLIPRSSPACLPDQHGI